MASYKIIVKPSVEKDFRSIPHKVAAKVWEHIERLKDNPFPPQSIKLAGAEQLYRLRMGDYRMIYGVDTKAKQVTVHYIRHRREVYRHL